MPRAADIINLPLDAAVRALDRKRMLNNAKRLQASLEHIVVVRDISHRSDARDIVEVKAAALLHADTAAGKDGADVCVALQCADAMFAGGTRVDDVHGVARVLPPALDLARVRGLGRAHGHAAGERERLFPRRRRAHGGLFVRMRVRVRVRCGGAGE